MEQEKVIREKIFDEVYIKAGKKVRNVFYIGALADGTEIYALCGNSNNIFAIAKVDNKNNIEIVI